MISVIIITNNRQKEILQVLEFLNAQTYKEFEVIIIDNGSKINLKKKEKLANYNYKLKYFYYKNILGRSKARNIGAYHAKGDILLFIDDTILLYNNVLSEIYNFFSRKKNIVLFSFYKAKYFSSVFLNDNSMIKNKFILLHNNKEKAVKTLDLNASLILAITKQNFYYIGGFDEIFGKRYGFEDWDFTVRARQNKLEIWKKDLIYIHNYHKKEKNDDLNSKGFYINFGLFILKHYKYFKNVKYLYGGYGCKNVFFNQSKKRIKFIITSLKKGYFFCEKCLNIFTTKNAYNKHGCMKYYINNTGKMVLRYI